MNKVRIKVIMSVSLKSETTKENHTVEEFRLVPEKWEEEFEELLFMEPCLNKLHIKLVYSKLELKSFNLTSHGKFTGPVGTILRIWVPTKDAWKLMGLKVEPWTRVCGEASTMTCVMTIDTWWRRITTYTKQASQGQFTTHDGCQPRHVKMVVRAKMSGRWKELPMWREEEIIIAITGKIDIKMLRKKKKGPLTSTSNFIFVLRVVGVGVALLNL